MRAASLAYRTIASLARPAPHRAVHACVDANASRQQIRKFKHNDNNNSASFAKPVGTTSFSLGIRVPNATIAMAEVDDYPVDEERVMRGDDHRIRPAVENAVVMGFDEREATEVAKREIVKFPGREDVTELVVDALLSGRGGGQRAFPPLPPDMPEKVARRWATTKTKTTTTEGGAIDLTAESPEPRDDHGDDKRRKLHVAGDTKGKGVIVDKGKDVVTIDDDEEEEEEGGGGGHANGAVSSGGGSGGGGNSLMAELARQRMARERERGGAAAPTSAYAAVPRSTANDRTFGGGGGGGSSRGNDLTGAAARAATLSNAPGGGTRSDGAAGGGGGVGSLGILDALLSGVAPLKEPLEEVRLLTYNVWFAEHVALVDRVQGLSDVVMDTDPHVICLQEVTPNILMLLHATAWFEEYKGSTVPPQQYFTVTLFKRSMDKPDKTTREVRREFVSSRMGRYTVGVGGMECGGGRELSVMSSHLESFISKEENSSAERVRQMKESLRTMDALLDRRAREHEGSGVKCRNAVFMGDTNWDETTDGNLPLSSGWIDAWLTHGDGTKGYTYDMKKNPMMGGHLQKRLDRVLYSLEDFEVSEVRMVGTEPVKRKDGSTVMYVNEYRGRRETRPVLPSDHFGLLVTLKPK